MKGILGGLFNNQTVFNTALGALRKWMQKDNITAVFIIQKEVEEGPTPGIDIKAFNEEVGLLTGEDYQEYLQFRRWKDEGGARETYDFLDGVFICTLPEDEKEVSNGI